MTEAGNRQLRVAIWQAEPGTALDPPALTRLAALRPDVIVLPEYFWVRSTDRSAAEAAAHYEEDRAALSRLSREVDAAWVGGTLVEPGGDGRLHNSCFVFDRGEEVLAYRKQRLMPGEAAGGIHPGDRTASGEVRGVRLGLLICADVFEPSSWEALAPSKPHLIAVPTNSPFRPADTVEEKFARDHDYFVRGARRTGAWVAKACTVGRVFGRPVQGRSLIAGPEGVLMRISPEEEASPRLLAAEIPLPDCV